MFVFARESGLLQVGLCCAFSWNFCLIKSQVTQLHIFPACAFLPMSRLLVLNGYNLRSCCLLCKKLLHVHSCSKVYYFHSDCACDPVSIPGANPMYPNVRTHAIRGFRIISLETPQHLRLAWLEAPHWLAHRTCVFKCESHASCASSFQHHERNARRVCVCVCSNEPAYAF